MPELWRTSLFYLQSNLKIRTIDYGSKNDTLPFVAYECTNQCFYPPAGVAEYMAMVIPEPGVGDFAVQLEHIRSTIEYLLTEEWQGDVLPLLKRYFISVRLIRNFS